MSRPFAPALILLLLLVAACTRSPEPFLTGDAAADFSAVEGQLLGAEQTSMEYHIASEGAFAADIRGTMRIRQDGVAEIKGHGSFGGRPVDLTLVSDGSTMAFGNGPDVTEAPTPAQLHEAIIIGFTRMGLLHNLARLTASVPPDHGDGGVQEWVVTGPFTPDSSGMTFDITVSGQPAGSASLLVDDRGFPVRRTQTVAFPTGEMRVTETYAAVTLQASSSP